MLQDLRVTGLHEICYGRCERYDMCEMRDTKQWNYIEILQSITYLLSDRHNRI